MKYSNTAVRELSAKYRSILKKCALLNAIVLMSAAFAMPAISEELTENVTQAKGRVVESDLTIDFKDHTYSAFSDPVGSSGTENQLFQLLQKNNEVTFRNGTIDVSSAATGDFRFLIQNYSNLTLDHMILDGSDLSTAKVPYTLSNNNGNVTISNSTIISHPNGNAFDVYYYNKGGYTTPANTILDNSNVQGNIEIGGDGNFDGTQATLTMIGANTINGNMTNAGIVNINTTDDAASTITGRINNTGVLNVNNATFKDNTNDSGWSAAIYSGDGGKITVKNSTFENNVAAAGGALASGTKSTGTELENVEFKNNSAEMAGAVALFKNSTLKNVKFTGNKATLATDEGAGALFLGSVSTTSITDGLFQGNESASSGGAIATRYSDGTGTSPSQQAAELTISNTTFTGNTAQTAGGAIYNTFYNDMNEAGEGIVIANSTFVNNTSGKEGGGAIYNDGTGDLYKKVGVITLAGTNIFSGNKAAGVLNDIHNEGELNISGNLTLDGGITGKGTIAFTGETNLTARLLSSASIQATTVTGLDNVTLMGLVIENGLDDGSYDLFSNGDDAFKSIDVENSLYTLSQGDHSGEIRIVKKSTSEVVENLAEKGVNAQQAATISAFADSKSGNAVLSAITEAVQSGNAKAAAKLAEEVAPTTSQTVMGVAQGVNSILNNVAGTRMAAVGRAGGDAFVGGAMWIQGLMNHTKQDSTSNVAGFTADTSGISFGIDGKVNEDLMVGIGYGYTNTDADSGNRDIDVDGHNFFVYSEYKPNNWYINGMFNYGFSKYDEQKVAGLGAKYDVNTYAANVMTGYDFDNGITPEIGLRYLLADQESYNDGVQRISTDKTDVLTGVVGIKYKADVKAKDWMFTPNLRLAATYDMVSDNSKANVSVIGGGNYQITGERLKRFGVETGVGIETTYKDWNLSVDYNGGFRKDFQSHTGMLKAKYNF